MLTATRPDGTSLSAGTPRGERGAAYARRENYGGRGALLLSYRVTETPLGHLLYVHGEQVGAPHVSLATAIAAAVTVMRERNEVSPGGGSWVLDWDGSYRWHGRVS